MREIGRTRWAIAEGYVPDWSHGAEPALTSHETVCLLKAGQRDAHVEITVYFSDRDPAGPYRVKVRVRRTRLDSRQAENALITTVAYLGAA